MPVTARATSNGDSVGDDRAATASYIATIAGDLAGIAKAHGFDTLAYILDMARLEAENNSQPPPGPN
jgi:hypothetical protein